MDDSITLLQQDYAKLANFYNLPSFDEFNLEFELIANVEYEGYFIEKYLIRTVLSRLQSYLNVLSSILEPTSNLVDFPESHIFSESELTNLQVLFRKIMYYARSFNYYLLLNDRSLMLKTLSSYLLDDHDFVRDSILDILLKLKGHWNKSSLTSKSKTESVRYFG